MRNPCAPVIVLLLLGTLLSPDPAEAIHFTQETVLKPSDLAAGDAFGREVALSSNGTVALVGAPGADCSAGADCGAAYVFVRSGNGWSEQAKLTAAKAAAGARLGHAIALSGDGSTALLRGRSTDCLAPATNCAVAHVFRHLGDSWVETAVLKTFGSFPTSTFDEAIRSMALSGDGRTALLGAPSCPPAGPCGIAHVYVRDGESWSEETRLTESDPAYLFGQSVDLSKDGLTALIGVSQGPEETTSDAYRVVGAYVFVRSGGAWIRQQRLAVNGSDFLTMPASPFHEVTLSGDGGTALLNSPFGGCGHQLENGSGYCGALRSFARTGGSWTELPPLGVLGSSAFGFRAALSGDGAVALTMTPGAIVYEREGNSWVERQRSLAGHAMSLSDDGRTALTGVGEWACSAGQNCGVAYVYTAAAIVTVPTLGDTGMALLTLALITSALVLLRRRRFL